MVTTFFWKVGKWTVWLDKKCWFSWKFAFGSANSTQLVIFPIEILFVNCTDFAKTSIIFVFISYHVDLTFLCIFTHIITLLFIFYISKPLVFLINLLLVLLQNLIARDSVTAVEHYLNLSYNCTLTHNRFRFVLLGKIQGTPLQFRKQFLKRSEILARVKRK